MGDSWGGPLWLDTAGHVLMALIGLTAPLHAGVSGQSGFACPGVVLPQRWGPYLN